MNEIDAGDKIRITGQVFDEKSRPVGGVTVICDGEETKTLFDGRYGFKGLASSSHIIEVNVEGYRRQREQIKTGKEGETVLDFHLEAGAGDIKIYGYVLDKSTGEPVKTGGSVYMLRPIFNRSTSIDPMTGYYEFSYLPSGMYTLWTSVLEYEDETKIIGVQRSEERRENFLIRRKEDKEVPWG